MQTALFTQALGLQAPWQVDGVELDAERGRLDIQVRYGASNGPCPRCQALDQSVHDRKRRSWRHLDFFQFEAHVHCDVPRVACSQCGHTSQLTAPWARAGSHFTLMFEAFGLSLVAHTSVAQTARQLRCSDNAVWRQIEAHVAKARALEDYSSTRTIGIDETACAKGHSYLTLVHDLDSRRLIFATPGKDASTVERFTQDLSAHKGKATDIEVVCMDMSKAYMAGVAQHVPQAAIAFDAFHVVQLANKALDQTRQEEMRQEGKWLKKTRWYWLMDSSRWGIKAQEQMSWLSQTRLKTARAWRIKEALRDIYRVRGRVSAQASEQALKRWLGWTQRAKLPAMTTLAKTIKQHWKGIVHAFTAQRLHNGYVEAANSLLQAAKAKARGYGTTRHFIAIAFLICGKLKHLPASPFKPAAPRRPALG